MKFNFKCENIFLLLPSSVFLYQHVHFRFSLLVKSCFLHIPCKQTQQTSCDKYSVMWVDNMSILAVYECYLLRETLIIKFLAAKNFIWKKYFPVNNLLAYSLPLLLLHTSTTTTSLVLLVSRFLFIIMCACEQACNNNAKFVYDCTDIIIMKNIYYYKACVRVYDMAGQGPHIQLISGISYVLRYIYSFHVCFFFFSGRTNVFSNCFIYTL